MAMGRGGGAGGGLGEAALVGRHRHILRLDVYDTLRRDLLGDGVSTGLHLCQRTMGLSQG